MKEEQSATAIVCRLSEPELREREATLIAQFKSEVVVAEELPDGYAFRVRDDSASITTVAELIAAERECCPFLKFALIAEPNLGPVVLRITGPAGSKELLASFLQGATSSVEVR